MMSSDKDMPEPRHCAFCGAKTDWVTRDGDHRPVELCPVCGTVLFRNSVPCAGALIVDDGRLLLLHRTIEPFRGHWDIPGGFLEEGEHPEVGVRREVMEETGLDVRPDELLGFYIDHYSGEGSCTTLNIYYICSVEAGEPRALEEGDAVEWFPLDRLPKEIAFPDHVADVLSDLKRKLEAKRSG